MTMLGLVVAAGLVMGLIAFRMTGGSARVATAAVGAKAIGGDPRCAAPVRCRRGSRCAARERRRKPPTPNRRTANRSRRQGAARNAGSGSGDAPGTTAEPSPPPAAAASSEAPTQRRPAQRRAAAISVRPAVKRGWIVAIAGLTGAIAIGLIVGVAASLPSDQPEARRIADRRRNPDQDRAHAATPSPTAAPCPSRASRPAPCPSARPRHAPRPRRRTAPPDPDAGDGHHDQFLVTARHCDNLQQLRH